MSSSLLEALRSGGVADMLPPGLEQQLAGLAFEPSGADQVGDLRLRRGDVKAPDPAALPALAWLRVQAPDLAGPSGLPAQLAVELDGGAVKRWAIDLRLDRMRLPAPGLRPAREAGPPGGPAKLEEDPAAGGVALVGQAVLRIASAGGDAPEVGLVGAIDPADPFGVHGAVAELAFEPASFFLGPSSFGFTVATVTYDDSDSASPAPKPAQWRGLAIREATLFLPPGAPVVGDVSLGVQDLFLGDPVGVDGSAAVELGIGDPAHGSHPYSVRIEVEWHDAGARGIAEAVPSRAEAIVRWPGAQLALPAGGNAAVSVPGAPPGTPPPTWALRGSWGHDGVSGSDEFTLALDVAGSPAGIAQVSGRPLAGALGLAPALLGAADNPAGGDAARVAALIAALGAAAEILLQDGSRTIVNGVRLDRVEPGSGAGARTRLTVDYTVELGFQVGAAGLPVGVSTLPEQPMKLRYHGVGVEIETAASHWYDGVSLIMDGVVPEVVDPGAWRLSPPLDDLLRVTRVRSGAQSQWLEVELAMAADLGVVELSDATVRVVFGSGGIEGVELRGLRATVSVPEVVDGEGALDVSGGALRAGVDVEVLPLKLDARADLALEGEMVALTVGVRFPAPIPFANSGLGLFGVIGRFVSKGERAIDRQVPDPVERELKWLERPSRDKYKESPDQYAMGLGAVIGTVPDAGFTFNAVGMVTVEFPRPAVILGVFAKVLSGTPPEPSDQATPPGTGISITGLIVIDDEAVTVALRGRYDLGELLTIEVPLGAWFPFVNPARSWVHLGSDGQPPDRYGPPVSVVLLPHILEQRVWAFVMVHGNGLSPGLMGKPDFAFDGFSIGFGAGWEIAWSAGPIRLEASAMVLAGFGTEPLLVAAGIWVRGSLDLVVLRIAARGEITLLSDGTNTDLRGEFCGEVDLFFFSLSGCVGIEISASLGGPPPPRSPVTGVDLVSRFGVATAAAPRAGAGEPPPVWPDAIPVVHFSHFVDVALGESAFAIGAPLTGPVWSGSRNLKYAYRITEVKLEPVDGALFGPPPGQQFESAWWWPSVRRDDVPPPLSAAGIETRDLALLSWKPWTGALPLSDPAGSPADPTGMVGSICEAVERAETLCLLGLLGRPSGAGAATLAEAPESAERAKRGPARLRLVQPGDALDWEQTIALCGFCGIAVDPARVAELSAPASPPGGGELESGWRLASLVRGGQGLGSLGATGAYDPPLEDPTLVLEVCAVDYRREVPVEPFELSGELVGESAAVMTWSPGPGGEPEPPAVTGVSADGEEETWQPRVVREGRCIEVHYQAPWPGPWSEVRIAAAPGRRVSVVASCGTHWHTALRHRQAEQHRQEMLATFSAHAIALDALLGEAVHDAPLPFDNPGPKRQLLPANAEFRLVISWEWQAWNRVGGGAAPGPPASGAWQAGGSEEFRFRTAAPAPQLNPAPPVDLLGESPFDPRGVGRYVTAVLPSGELPHLLDDPVRVVFSVDYLPALLNAYGFETRVEVLPTDVKPGSLAGGLHPPTVVDTVKLFPWLGDGALRPVEKLVADAIAASACLPDSGLGGVAATVSADLEPGTAYDLILLAARNQGKDRRPIHRSHFRTSRYRDVGELLEVLGLPLGGAGEAPPDLLLSRPWPNLPQEPHDDAGFEAALAALGLDPWPLSSAPRTTGLWLRSGDADHPEWRFGGVLLEAPEPIARKGRILASGSVGAAALAHRWGTSSGTRVLLAPSSPLLPGPADALAVRLQDTLRGRVADGAAQLLGGPRTIREELG
jgi:hypothetical protein